MPAQGIAPAESSKPDSNDPYDGREVPRRSGIPPAGTRYSDGRTLAAHADERVQLALAESTRTSANLRSLLRGLSHLSAGAMAAQEANELLATELEALRQLLAASHEQESVLRHKVVLLEQGLEQAKRDAARERSFFIEQEDLFLSELLTDHERHVADLRRRLVRALVERDEAQTLAAEMTRERESMRPDADEPPPTPRAHTLRLPGQPPSSGGSGTAIGAIRLRPAPVPTLTPPPEGQTLAPPRPASRPPLRLKDSARPSGAYSLRGDQVPEDHAEPSEDDRITSRPPER